MGLPSDINPRRYLIRMIAFLLAVLVVALMLLPHKNRVYIQRGAERINTRRTNFRGGVHLPLCLCSDP